MTEFRSEGKIPRGRRARNFSGIFSYRNRPLFFGGMMRTMDGEVMRCE